MYTRLPQLSKHGYEIKKKSEKTVVCRMNVLTTSYVRKDGDRKQTSK